MFGGSRVLQMALNRRRERVGATEHASRGSFRVLERLHGFVEIVARGAIVHVERRRVNRPHLERGFTTLAENALRHGYLSAQKRFDFCEEP